MSERNENREQVKLLKVGQESTFRAIFITYFESLELFAKAYVLDQQIAKDIVQEVFTNLWSKKTSIPTDVNIKSYLYQATRNTCLNYLKKQQVRANYEKHTRDKYNELLLNYEALLQLNFDEFSYSELLNALNEAVLQLPEKCREVFELSRIEGLKNREIAEQLGISVKAVEGHITKALKHIKVQLKPHFPSKLILFLLSGLNRYGSKHTQKQRPTLVH
ncbi:RNA polymerase sigma-70 factor [Sunxiuqinia elliptica]|uniref:RNA polymerase sigma-70 factor (ECF subfamily) n=1 Tax=Sunxiuqinia elliptica TaxID=655355 RepID=A0A4R6GU57_9BACT|nr:RNA polymerase sigma-70 factor [Sunxiuqinia elliptica]TDN98971.1 RNA polymerase sigma-70 factor (ECF subfamily) [Sunxiuqinia elliptica]TDO56411.1 RNA polymerase sigma-70 factor (ECF subfamily) [Sunxiuqinia elliptica]